MKSKIYGVMYTCERCGKKEFFEAEERTTDGGYTKYYVTKGKSGWQTLDYRIFACPECVQTYRKMVDEFINNGREENETVEHDSEEWKTE